MAEKDTKPASPDDEDLEHEVRSHRSFSLAEAIGRLGGGDLLKGASPVTKKRQAEIVVELFLERYLVDGEGALLRVLQRRVKESEILLAAGYEQPLSALNEVTDNILGSESRLQSFVRQVDAEWGRMYRERPYFQRPGQPPKRDDPYTFSSVRETLGKLLDELRGHI